jgi:hypothetical protein
MEKAKVASCLLCDVGMKLDISGGEPFLNPKYSEEVCKEELNLKSISVVCSGSNVSYVTEKWIISVTPMTV